MKVSRFSLMFSGRWKWQSFRLRRGIKVDPNRAKLLMQDYRGEAIAKAWLLQDRVAPSVANLVKILEWSLVFLLGQERFCEVGGVVAEDVMTEPQLVMQQNR